MDHFVAPGTVFLLLLVTVLLNLGMRQQVVQAIEFSLFLLRAVRGLPSFSSQSGYIPVLGFDDFL